jgi:hypothetical protein
MLRDPNERILSKKVMQIFAFGTIVLNKPFVVSCQSPKKLLSSVTDFGTGQEMIASIFAGSVATP